MKFTIRDLLLVTVIVAVLTGWGLDRWRLARQVRELDLRSKRLLVDAELARTEAMLQRDVARQQLLQEARQFYQKQSAEESETPAAAP